MFKRDALTAEDRGELVLRLLREETTASDLSRAASTSVPGQRTANSSIPFLLAGLRRVIPTTPDTMKLVEAKQFSLTQRDILAGIATIAPNFVDTPNQQRYSSTVRSRSHSSLACYWQRKIWTTGHFHSPKEHIAIRS